VSGIICLRTAPHKSPPIFLHDLSKRNVKLAIGQAKISVFNTDHQVQRSHWDLLSRLLRRTSVRAGKFWGCEGFLPEKFSDHFLCIKTVFRMTSKNKTYSCDFGHLFFKSKHVGRHFCTRFQWVCEGCQRFCPYFCWFCPDFYKVKSFGGALAPPPLTPL